MKTIISGATLLVLATALPVQDIHIEAVNGSDTEQRGVEQLQRILGRYDLERWIFVDQVRIEDGVIPHSHPVLTLSTRLLDDDDEQVATFVHENFHWYVNQNREMLAAAVAEHRALYPDAPGREGGGARDPDSTYLHLVVCDLELQAMIELLGEARARELLGGYTHYPWIYERVLSDDRIHEINARQRVGAASGRDPTGSGGPRAGQESSPSA